MQKYQDNVYTWDYVMEQKRKREWDTLHPGDHNPYADLPELRILTFDLGKSLPTSYRYATTEMAFNFIEFFRVWTGDPAKDFRPLPSGAQVGDFVHESDVRSFLHLISSDDPESNYPFSTPECREMFRHTLWMVPGVKEAAALSRLLKEESSGFESYKIANVAGDGDAEMPYDNALHLVQKVIHENRYTITISCGKLTTGVTVPEWTAVMMLTGSASTAASGYRKTIFRVQSAGVLDGKQKERCYVFDFAPDRALNVLSEVNRITKRGKTNEEENRKALGEFLNFCPVIAVDGTQMTEYSVPKMMRQLKRLTVDKAIKSGFDDESVYKQDTGIVMDEDDVELFHTLSDKLSEQKAAKKETKVHINNQGLTDDFSVLLFPVLFAVCKDNTVGVVRFGADIALQNGVGNEASVFAIPDKPRASTERTSRFFCVEFGLVKAVVAQHFGGEVLFHQAGQDMHFHLRCAIACKVKVGFFQALVVARAEKVPCADSGLP